MHVNLHHLFIIVICISACAIFIAHLILFVILHTLTHFLILFSSPYPSSTTSVMSKLKIHMWVRIVLSVSHWSVGFEISKMRLLIFCLSKSRKQYLLSLVVLKDLYAMFSICFCFPKIQFSVGCSLGVDVTSCFCSLYIIISLR